METDSGTCPQKSEFQDECSSKEGKSHFADDSETAVTQDHTQKDKDMVTDPQDMKNKDEEAVRGLEKTETPDNSFPTQPNDHPTSSPVDGAIEATEESLSSTVENDPNGNQEWPPVPGLEEDIQPERNECQANEMKVKENTETSEDVQTTEGEEAVIMTQIPKAANEEEGHELESHGDSDSIVFLSENSEEQNIDCKHVDFATTREQWVRRDSRCDEPSNLTYSKSASKSLLPETEPSSSTHSESTTEPTVNAEDIQQGEPEVNNPSLNENENEEVQQVCGAAPPLETVAVEPTNPEQGNSACISTEVKEPLIMPQGRRDSKREERESSETGEERKQTVCFAETGGTEGKQLGEVKDQRQERENNGQRAESQSNTKPHLREGKVNRMQVDHFDDSQSDSGVSADFSPNSTTDVLDGHYNDAPQPSESPPNETPIEREIRLTMKREQSLRRSRGLCDNIDRTNEFVEIPVRKPILSQDLQIRSNPSHGKDRQFAGKKMQKEISAETAREKVLVELGRLPGFYDKGTEVQLEDKKQLFESFQEPKESVATISRRSATVEYATGIQEVDSAVDVKQLLMQFSQNSPTPPATAQYGATNGNLSAARGPGLNEGIKGQIIIIEANTIPITVRGPNGGYKTTSCTDGGSVRQMNSTGVRASSAEPVRARQGPNLEVTEDSSLAKENPFFKLRSSMSLQSQVELDIEEAKERERELQRQRNSLYGGAAMYTEEGRGTGMDLRTEIRERVRELRGTSSQGTPSPQQTPAGHQSETFTTTTSVRQSTGKLDLTWPPPQADEEQRQLSEKTVKIARQKNPLLERWESGMVNGHVEDDD